MPSKLVLENVLQLSVVVQMVWLEGGLVNDVFAVDLCR